MENVTLFAAFLAGVLSFVSVVLPLIPAISLVSGVTWMRCAAGPWWGPCRHAPANGNLVHAFVWILAGFHFPRGIGNRPAASRWSVSHSSAGGGVSSSCSASHDGRPQNSGSIPKNGCNLAQPAGFSARWWSQSRSPFADAVHWPDVWLPFLRSPVRGTVADG